MMSSYMYVEFVAQHSSFHFSYFIYIYIIFESLRERERERESDYLSPACAKWVGGTGVASISYPC